MQTAEELGNWGLISKGFVWFPYTAFCDRNYILYESIISNKFGNRTIFLKVTVIFIWCGNIDNPASMEKHCFFNLFLKLYITTYKQLADWLYIYFWNGNTLYFTVDTVTFFIMSSYKPWWFFIYATCKIPTTCIAILHKTV